MPRFEDNYYKRTRQTREDVENKRLNLAMRSREKVFDDWQIINTQDPEKERETEPSFRVMNAPTTNPDRPRALKIAYSVEAQKLVVKFRGKKGAENNGPWIEYYDIPVDFWNDLKASNSTGLYLRYSGLDDQPWGYFNPAEMPPETRVMFND
jgi:hypothetical protein